MKNSVGADLSRQPRSCDRTDEDATGEISLVAASELISDL